MFEKIKPRLLLKHIVCYHSETYPHSDEAYLNLRMRKREYYEIKGKAVFSMLFCISGQWSHGAVSGRDPSVLD